MRNSFHLAGVGRKCLTLLTLSVFLFTHSAFAALVVNNGNFSTLTGLTNGGGGWYHGVPNSWTTLSGTNYIIHTTGGAKLNLDHAGTISQSLGTVVLGQEDVTISFDYGDVWGGGYYAANEDMITAELWDTTTNTLLTSKTVKNTWAYGSLVSDSISTSSSATVGNTLEVRFTSLPGTWVTPGSAAALDNVAVTATDTTAPTITNITTTTANGSYPAGAIIPIDVTFSEVVTSTGNVTVTLDTGSTCTFTVTASTTGSCNYTVLVGENSSDLTVSSIAGTIKDATLNSMINFVPTTNLATNKAIIIDTTAPTVGIVMAPTTLKIGDTSLVTFTFSEPVTSFDATDVTTPSGSIGAVSVTGNPLTYTGTFTPTTPLEAPTNSITVGTSWSDTAGNAPVGSTTSANYIVDTLAPVISETVPVVTPSNIPNPQYSFNSTEAGTISTSGGSCSGFTSSAVVVGANTITFNSLAGSPGWELYDDCTLAITDAVGNVSNTIDISDFTIDTSTLPLVITLSNYTIKIGDTPTVSFTFWEAPIGFDDADITVVNNGTLSTIAGSGTLYTATFTPTANLEATSNIITVGTGWTDQALNSPSSDTNLLTPYSIDTLAPTVTSVSIVSNNVTPTLAKEGDVITVSFTTSEPVNLPTATIAGKTATVTNTGGNNYTATYTLTATETQGVAAIAIDFDDIVGNDATQVTAVTDASSVTIDTIAPSISNIASTPLFPPGSAITWTTSEAATSQVEYGLTTSYGSITTLDSTLVMSHTVNVTGLTAPETYHFLVVTADAAGNISTSIIGANTAVTSNGGGAPFGSSGGLSFQVTPTPVNNPNPTIIPTNPTPTTETTPTTPESTPTPNPENPTPPGTTNTTGDNSELIPTSFPNETETDTTGTTGGTTTGGTTTGGGTTGGGTTTGGSTTTGGTFNPASATLDAGGGATPEEPEVVELKPAQEIPQDIGGWVVPEEESHTLAWTLLGLVVLLNFAWFYSRKNSIPTR